MRNVRILLLQLPICVGLLSQTTAEETPDYSGQWQVQAKIGPVRVLGRSHVTLTTTPLCILQQGGSKVTGTCKGPNNIGTVTGTVEGQRIQFRWSAVPYKPLGISLELSFDGSLQPESSITGLVVAKGYETTPGTFAVTFIPANNAQIQIPHQSGQ